MADIFLSIIIPAYNEEHRLPKTLDQIFSFLRYQPYQAEVIVVDNGSQDRTLEIARLYSEKYPQLRVLHTPERGKGLAVRMGMLEACGQYRFMCDADLSMPIGELNRFFPPVQAGFDIAIASREAQGSIRYQEPAYRHLGGRLINWMIQFLALPGLHDTQCGFKSFRKEVAEDLFREQTLNGWAFDVELLFIARRRGYRIVEVPIPWYFNKESKVSAVRDAVRMTSDILKVRLNAMRGTYNGKV